MGASSCLSKCVIIFINLFIWIGAALMLFAGTAYFVEGNGVSDDVSGAPGYVAIVIGVLLFVIGLIGICGACTEKKGLIWTFLIICLLALGLLMYTSITVFKNKQSYTDTAEDSVLDQFNSYNSTDGFSSMLSVKAQTSTPPLSKNGTTTVATTTTTIMTTLAPSTNANSFIDNIQSGLHCCGWANYTDWNHFSTWNKSNIGYVPASCCDKEAAAKLNVTCPDIRISMKHHKDIIFDEGCETDIDNILEFVFDLMAWSAVAFLVLVFFGVVGSVYLIQRRKRNEGFDYSSIVA